jgi:hypothetical protein
MSHWLMRATGALKRSRTRYGGGAGRPSRRPWRSARVAAGAIALAAGVVLATVPNAYADGGFGGRPISAFQANTSFLWFTGPTVGPTNTGLGMAARTNPSIAVLSNGGHEAAFQANTGILWFGGSQGIENTGLGMAPGTSPSIAGAPNAGFVVAFQGSNRDLWITGPGFSTVDTGLGMAAGTSPSVSYNGDTGEYRAAFQANTGILWFTGPGIGPFDTGLPMAAGTSPSITTTGGDFETAYQSSSGILATSGDLGTGLLGLGMAPGTSPAITTTDTSEITQPGGYQIAFQANTGSLWTTGGFGTYNTGLGMAAGTSPSITGIEGYNADEAIFDYGAYHVEFQANTGFLWTFDTNVNFINGNVSHSATNTGLGMATGTSPSTTSIG